MIPIPRELLEQLAREAPSEQRRRSNGQPGRTSTSPDNVQAVRSVLTDHGAEIIAEAPYKDSWRLLLACCPFDSSHKEAAVFVPASGRTGFHCFHESCKGKKWREVLLLWGVEEQSRPIDPEPASDRGNHSSYNWPDPLAEEAYHGVVGEIVKAIEPHSEADPAALLMQLLVGCGNIIGRKPFFVTEETLQYMSLYVVLVGQTAKARKGTSWGRTRGTLRDVDMEWAARRILGGLSSGEGVIWNVRDPMQEMSAVRERGRVVRYESVDSDPGETDKRLMVFEPEFARVLQSCERDTNTLSSVLRQAWDGEPLGILTKKNGARSTGPHI